MKKVKDLKILVIGDIMLDRYIIGTVDKISPEAPVPVVNVTKEYSTLGGCGNVVANLCTLGANIKVIAKVGDDEAANEIMNHLDELRVERNLVLVPEICTTEKIRIIAEHREMQMLRIDKEVIQENKNMFNDYLFNKYEMFDKEVQYDVIVVSDYAKGVISGTLMNMIRSHNSSKCPVIVDPKPKHASMYQECFMITPNTRELAEMQRHYIVPHTNYLLETQGKKGMILYDNYGDKTHKIDAKPVDVFNVTGAGDSVIAVMAVGIGMGYNVVDVATVANECAAFVVTQPGTTTVPRNLFETKIGGYKRCHT